LQISSWPQMITLDPSTQSSLDHKAILESQNSLRVLSKTLCFIQLQPLSDVLHSDVSLLSSDDVFLDGWNKC
jgi:hypothetical protein